METTSSLKFGARRCRSWRGAVAIGRDCILNEREGEFHIGVGFNSHLEPIRCIASKYDPAICSQQGSPTSDDLFCESNVKGLIVIKMSNLAFAHPHSRP